MKCPRCGAENPDHSTFCSLCLEVVGFEDPEMTTVEPAVDGYLTSYPSSFDPPAEQAGGPAGWYSPGDAFTAQGAVPPVPDAPPGAVPGQGGAPYRAPSEMGPRAVRPFVWSNAVLTCAEIALMAAVISVGLEILLGFVAINATFQGSFTVARIWLLMALLIPVCFAGYASGFKIQGYGWGVGLISVGFWAFLFRPLYYALLMWVLSGRFAFSAIVSAESLVFTIAVFMPLGALTGWLGEKRATTGLQFR